MHGWIWLGLVWFGKTWRDLAGWMLLLLDDQPGILLVLGGPGFLGWPWLDVAGIGGHD